MNIKTLQRMRGFTLIELLVVIAIISSLSVAVLVAFNPAGRLLASRDARRTTDVNSILSAIHQAIVDGEGALPTGLTTSMAETQLGTAGSGCAISTGGCSAAAAACVDLTTPLAAYLKSIPVDPDGTAAMTKYSITVDANNIITIKACGSEGDVDISISR